MHVGTPLHVLSGGVGGGREGCGYTSACVVWRGGGGEGGMWVHLCMCCLEGWGGGGRDVGFLKVAAVPANLSPHTLYGIRHIQYMTD